MHDMESRTATSRPHFYVVRPEPCKNFVPLIPVDELPSFLRLEGVPLSLDVNMINDWNMARVGDTTPRLGEYGVQISMEEFRNYHPPTDDIAPGDSASRGGQKEQDVPNGGISATSNAAEPSGTRAYVPISTLKDHMQASMGELADKAKWEKENDPSKTKDAMTPGIFGKKKYCTHWIRTGNCDYVQEGCKYLHVIPDEDTRMQIGIRDMPRWAKEDLPPPPSEPTKVRGRWTAAANKSWRRQNRSSAPSVVMNQSSSFKTGSSKPSTPLPPTSRAPKLTNGHDHSSAREEFQVPSEIAPSSLSGLTNEISASTADHSHVMDKQSRRDSTANANNSLKRHLLVNSTPIPQPSPSSSTNIQSKMTEPQGSPNYHYQAHHTLAMGSRSADIKPEQPLPPLHNAAPASNLGMSSPISHASNASPSHNQPPNLYFTQKIPYPNLTPLPAYIDQHSNRQQMLPQQYQGGYAAQPLSYSSAATCATPMTNTEMPLQPAAANLATLPPESQSPTAQSEGQHVGIIGQGRPTLNLQTQLHQPKPNTSFPVHRRLFVNPGEERYIIGQPEPEKPKGSGKASKKRQGPKGRGRNAYESENLISFDADQSTDG